MIRVITRNALKHYLNATKKLTSKICVSQNKCFYCKVFAIRVIYA